MKRFKRFFALNLVIWFCAAALGDFSDPVSLAGGAARSDGLLSSRDLYNAGTRQLRKGKLNEAETLLQSALAKEDERVQASALYNLGHVRMAQGSEELKKAASAGAAQQRGETSDEAAGSAVRQGEAALAGNDVRRMVEAYMAGRGARKEIRAATEAVRRAMEAHGKTLLKWRRSLGDFRSAVELDSNDAAAAKNAETVARAIAKLVDSLRQMRNLAMKMGGSQARLNEVLQQLKGRIPKDMMPPGAPGDEVEDFPAESLTGMKEAPTSGGEQMQNTLSPEEAGYFLEGIQPDGKFLPMGQGDLGKPRQRSMRTW